MILLDTHVLVWLISRVEKLSRIAREEIRRARSDNEPIAISGITLFEIASLTEKKRISISTTLDTLLRSLEESFRVIPISGRCCAKTVELPPAFPRDPGDRIIAATAIVEGMTLITADINIRKSKVVETLW